MNILISLLICMALTTSSGIDNDTGTISGTVLDEAGAPLSEALVEAEPGGVVQRAKTHVKTDAVGRFAISNLPFKTYKIYISKPTDFYPDTGYAFYSKTVTKVILSRDKQHSNLDIRLGPRAGRINGQTVDRATGAPIPATFRLTRRDDPKSWYAVSQPADFEFLVPSGTAVTLHVEASGYKVWDSVDVVLLPRETRTFRIELEPN